MKLAWLLYNTSGNVPDLKRGQQLLAVYGDPFHKYTTNVYTLHLRRVREWSEYKH